jgi:hypothetical protein
MSTLPPTVDLGMFDGITEVASDGAEVRLSGRRPRDLLDGCDLGGNLTARQPRSQIVHERGNLDGLPQLHHRDRCLAKTVIGVADDRRTLHRRVALQRGAHGVGHHL